MSNAEILMDAIGDISPSYLIEYYRSQKRNQLNKRIIKYSTVAASVIAIAIVALAFFKAKQDNIPIDTGDVYMESNETEHKLPELDLTNKTVVFLKTDGKFVEQSVPEAKSGEVIICEKLQEYLVLDDGSSDMIYGVFVYTFSDELKSVLDASSDAIREKYEPQILELRDRLKGKPGVLEELSYDEAFKLLDELEVREAEAIAAAEAQIKEQYNIVNSEKAVAAFLKSEAELSKITVTFANGEGEDYGKYQKDFLFAYVTKDQLETLKADGFGMTVELAPEFAAEKDPVVIINNNGKIPE